MVKEKADELERKRAGLRAARAASRARGYRRSRMPPTPAVLAQFAQQKTRPLASTPWPITRQPQWAHVGASAWMAHSKLSKTCVLPLVITWKLLSYSL